MLLDFSISFLPGLKHNPWCINMRIQCVLLWRFTSLDLTDSTSVVHNRYRRSKRKIHYQNCVQNKFNNKPKPREMNYGIAELYIDSCCSFCSESLRRCVVNYEGINMETQNPETAHKLLGLLLIWSLSRIFHTFQWEKARQSQWGGANIWLEA